MEIFLSGSPKTDPDLSGNRPISVKLLLIGRTGLTVTNVMSQLASCGYAATAALILLMTPVFLIKMKGTINS